jgi:hypothetical protein
MADILPVFEKLSVGVVTQAGATVWVDVGSFGPDTMSPITSGKRIWVGYITCICVDKNATFELRPNLVGQSTGTDGTTDLRGFVAVASGDSKDLDVYYGGAINTLAPTSGASTGVEKLWLKIVSGSGSSATYEFIMYYSLY